MKNEWVYVVRWKKGRKLSQREFQGDGAEALARSFYHRVAGNRNEAVLSRIRGTTVGERVVATGRGIIKKIWGG